ncbi:hypothetical protein F5050DRAFT_1873843 [Lentinula boryana]|uniref:Peptidase A2 domain-containing protein n=1 Tax=Lentinula boryana TaxID=40481 RepID=A0ABQ8PXE1_9AGAR|nr:hypothetical protein F5050DRAFT_1873843 [Lentinula boryana]
MGNAHGKAVAEILNVAGSYPGDYIPGFELPPTTAANMKKRFRVYLSKTSGDMFVVNDTFRRIEWSLNEELLDDPRFNVHRWVCKCYVQLWRDCFEWDLNIVDDYFGNIFSNMVTDLAMEASDEFLANIIMKQQPTWRVRGLEVNGVQIPANQYSGLQRNASRPRDPARMVARPIVIAICINGEPVTALLDSGSLGMIMSTTLVDQLKPDKRELNPPLTLQLAVQGSRSKINRKVCAWFQYQGIDKKRDFDVANINYPLILGTDWMYEYSVTIGFNEA